MQQSASLVQAPRQTALTHIFPSAQSVLARHSGCGPLSGLQTPPMHRSRAPQSVSAWQSA
jgi:hypothetical protein